MRTDSSLFGTERLKMDMENTEAGDDPRAGSVARFGLIDRRTPEAPSRLDAFLYACHPQLVNGYRGHQFRAYMFLSGT